MKKCASEHDARLSLHQPAMPSIHTFTYSPEAGARSPVIHLDVHVPQEHKNESPLRTVIWFHGGGLLQGSRKNLAPHMASAVDRERIALISIDYRHAPQVRLPDIQSDVAKAYNYVIHTLPRLHVLPLLDLEEIVVSGSSAGGWLALMLGLGMLESAGVKEQDRKRIKGLAAVYPITDVGVEWWDGPRAPMIQPLWPDEIYEKLSDPNAPAESNTEGIPQTNPRTQFYHYAQKHGLFRSLLFTDSQLSSGWLDKSSVAKFIRSQGATCASAWPNIYLNHGNPDTAVPSSQSVDVLHALQDTQGFKGSLDYQQAEGKSHMYDAFDEREDMSGLWEFVRAQFG